MAARARALPTAAAGLSFRRWGAGLLSLQSRQAAHGPRGATPASSHLSRHWSSFRPAETPASAPPWQKRSLLAARGPSLPTRPSGRLYSAGSQEPPKPEKKGPVIYAPPPHPSGPPLQPPKDAPPSASVKTTTPTSTPKKEPIRNGETEDSRAPEDKPSSSSSSSFSNNDNDNGSSSFGLPSAAEKRRSPLAARFARFMDDLQARAFAASQTLSDLTGYTAIEQIKARNAELERELAAAQDELRAARRAYQAVNAQRAATQREVTTLLARKDSWAPPDLERFTDLYRRDHEMEAGALRATDRLQEAEAREARLSAELTQGILKRYHEEQVWSDRIRRQSTWGTWGLMAVNVLLFVVLQVFAEPWRRRRLMRGIAEAESGVLEDVRRELADVRAALAAATTTAAIGETLPVDAQEVAAAVLSSDKPPEELDEAAAAVIAAAAAAALATPALGTGDGAQPDSIIQPLQALSSPPPVLPGTGSWSWQGAKAFASDPARWKAWALDLYSERLVHVRMRDVSFLAIQSAAAGAAIVGGLVFALRRA